MSYTESQHPGADTICTCKLAPVVCLQQPHYLMDRQERQDVKAEEVLSVS